MVDGVISHTRAGRRHLATLNLSDFVDLLFKVKNKLKSAKRYKLIQILRICDERKRSSRTKQLSMVVDRMGDYLQKYGCWTKIPDIKTVDCFK